VEPELNKQVENEGMSILRLCADLREFIDTGRTKATYLPETGCFLVHIVTTLNEIDGFIRQSIDHKLDEELVEARLRDFGQIKNALSWFYGFAKAAIGADSLSIPFALATFINHIGKKLPRCDKASLVVIGAPSLMYYKCNLKDLRDLTKFLHERIPDCPVLSEDIGILMFPYCFTNDVLVNCDLFHEMGHYIYETTDIEERVRTEISQDLIQFFMTNKIFGNTLAI